MLLKLNKVFKFIIAVYFFLFFSLFCFGVETNYPALVVSVHDGDTITVLRNNEKIKIRLIGVDCPELKQIYGMNAKEFTSSLVLNKTVKIVLDKQEKDKYNRTLAYVYFNNTFINEKILEAGFGITAFYAPNLKKYYELKEAEKKAKLLKLNVWNDLKPLLETPSDFRHKKK